MRVTPHTRFFALIALAFCLNSAFGAAPDERNKPGDDKKSKLKKDDTTHYVLNDEAIETPDTSQILFPSNDLYASWDTSVVHPYNFSDCFRADSTTLCLSDIGESQFFMPYRGNVT